MAVFIITLICSSVFWIQPLYKTLKTYNSNKFYDKKKYFNPFKDTIL